MPSFIVIHLWIYDQNQEWTVNYKLLKTIRALDDSNIEWSKSQNVWVAPGKLRCAINFTPWFINWFEVMSMKEEQPDQTVGYCKQCQCRTLYTHYKYSIYDNSYIWGDFTPRFLHLNLHSLHYLSLFRQIDVQSEPTRTNSRWLLIYIHITFVLP